MVITSWWFRAAPGKGSFFYPLMVYAPGEYVCHKHIPERLVMLPKLQYYMLAAVQVAYNSLNRIYIYGVH